MSDFDPPRDLEEFFDRLDDIIREWDENEVISSTDAMEKVRDLVDDFQVACKSI